MSLSEILILSGIVAMFAAFVVVLGGTSLYLVISDLRDTARAPIPHRRAVRKSRHSPQGQTARYV